MQEENIGTAMVTPASARAYCSARLPKKIQKPETMAKPIEDPFSCSMAQRPTQDSCHIVYIVVCQKICDSCESHLDSSAFLGACLLQPWHATGVVAITLMCMSLMDREQEIDGWICDHASLHICGHDVSYYDHISLWHGVAASQCQIGATSPSTWHAEIKKTRLQMSIGHAKQGLEECIAYICVLQLVNEVFAMLRPTKLPQGQATHNWYKHKANAKVLEGKSENSSYAYPSSSRFVGHTQMQKSLPISDSNARISKAWHAGEPTI